MEFQEKIIKDDILEKMSLENVYKILNDNIFPMLNEEEKNQFLWRYNFISQ